jgi:hypothetical protein
VVGDAGALCLFLSSASMQLLLPTILEPVCLEVHYCDVLGPR